MSGTRGGTRLTNTQKLEEKIFETSDIRNNLELSQLIGLGVGLLKYLLSDKHVDVFIVHSEK